MNVPFCMRAGSSGPGTAATSWPISVTDGQLELLKWIAFAGMLVDHVGRYAFGLPLDSWAFVVSRVSFPLFALVLAVNLARAGDRQARAWRTASRLALWAAISTLPAYWARGEWLPLNVLFTFALAAMLISTVERTRGWGAAAATGCIVLTAAVVEFGPFGVLLVVTAQRALVTANLVWALLSVGSLLALALLHGALSGPLAAVFTMGSLLAILIALRINVHLPRRAAWFYWSYPIHLVAVAVLALVV